MAFDQKTHSILIKILNIENLDESAQEKIIAESGSLIYQMVLVKAFELMTEDQVNEFEKLIETNPAPETVFEFFREKIPQFDTLIEEEGQRFVDEGKDLMNQIG